MQIDWDKVVDTLNSGWGKGILKSPGDGRHCILGALYVGMDIEINLGTDYDERVTRVANQHLLPIIKEQFPSRLNGYNPDQQVYRFNDDSRTTKEDVLLVVEKARANQ